MLPSGLHSLRLRLLGVLVLLLALLPGCDLASNESPSFGVEPLDVIFHPETKGVTVALVNDGREMVSIENLRITGDDKDAFSLPQELPKAVGPRRRVTVDITVDAAAFEQGTGRRGRPPEYRDGRARFAFEANGELHVVPVTFETPSWLVQYVIPALIKILALVLVFVVPLAAVLTWMERKQSAMMQDRFGPNMAGFNLFGRRIRLWGLVHVAADGLKMLFKEDFVPRRAHQVLYTLAPLMAFVPAVVVFAIVPFGDAICYGRLFDVVSQADVNQCAAGRGGTILQVAQIDVGLLFYFAIASLATYGTVLAGWSSYNKWAILGGLRASAQMVSYEVAIGMTIVGALLVYGTLEPHTLVHAQAETHWGVILQPIAFVLFFTAVMAETKRAPFDLPEGDSEIVGYFLEYSGMRFGLFFLGEFIEVVFAGAMIVTLFLGGWTLPFGMLEASGFASTAAAAIFFGVTGLVMGITGVAAYRANPAARVFGALLVLLGSGSLCVCVFSAVTGWGTALPHLAVAAIGVITWCIKVAILCWLQLLIRWTLPRFRYDQLMTLGWKGLLPLSLANIVFTALVVYLFLPGKEALGP